MRPRLTAEALRLLAGRFRVLSHPLRLGILQALEGGERSVTTLANDVHATQSNVSQHLRLLEGAGLVRRRQDGTSVMCSIADPSVLELCDAVCHSLRGGLAAQAELLEPARPRRGAGGRS